MIDVKFEWTFPDSVIFLPHSYLVIVVWLFLLPVSRKCWQEWRTISIWKMIFYLLSRRAAAYGLSSGTCICWGSERCTGSRDLRPYRRRTSILHHYCNYRPQIPAGNRQVKRRNDGEQHSPYYARLSWFWFWQMAPQVPLWRTEAAGNLARRRGDCIGLSSPGSRSTRSTQTKLYCSDLMSCCPAQFFCAGYL